MDPDVLVILTITAALLFDVINGIHDAANSIGTIVSTRVLSPRVAVLWAAVFNFLALFIFHQGVAETIANMIHVEADSSAHVWVVIGGLAGAIAWNLFTWTLGLPSSSSHALIGGLCGAGIAFGGVDALQLDEISKIIFFIPLAPLMALLAGGVSMLLVYWAFRRARPQKVDRVFRAGQLVSASLYAMGYGGNDAQKTAGVIWVVMIAGGMLGANEAPPYWIFAASYGGLALGTAIGGWRLHATRLGITHVRPVGGFCAELAGALTLFFATHVAVPVSTTHTITGAIVGVGSTTNARGIRWALAARIVYAWILTIPAAGIAGAGAVLAARALGAY